MAKIGEAADSKLEKSPEDPKKKDWWKRVGGNILAGGLGVGAGLGAAQILARSKKFPFLVKPTPERVRIAKWTLPILGGAAFILGDRYRRLMDESHRQAPGWPDTRR